ncbi:MAG: hypothetical protein ABI315_12125 [Bacteroidia bacterium]
MNLKNRFLPLFFILILSHAYAGVVVLEGKYQNKNLYVKNNFAANGVGFCAYEVLINGKVTADETNSSAFEIDFSASGIKPGSNVIVEIKYKNDCTPKIINPEALKPKATFELINSRIDKNGLLIWTTKNEMGSLPFIVEQFRWNKWVKVGEINGKGELEGGVYSFQTTAHSGENRFRLKQIGYGGVAKLSNDLTNISILLQPTYALTKNGDAIQFSSETQFEIYDSFGNVLKQGFDKRIDISNLSKGNYYLCYDNVITDFKIRK